jgi:hypothetical protein
MKVAKKSGKMLVSGLFGVLIIAAVCLSCKHAAAGIADASTVVLYVAEQVGGESDTITSTGIRLTFESEISALNEDQITIDGAATKGSISGSGKVWTIELNDVTEQSEVTVLVGSADKEKTPKKVQIYKANNDSDGEFFKFTVRTTTANEGFTIPTNGFLNWNGNIPYNWNISWGDDITETKNGSSADTFESASHIYSDAGDYQITITPNGSTDAWMGAFGFKNSGDKDKIISVDSALTLLMTRTHKQINNGKAPTYEWSRTFQGCQNPEFKMGPNFKFAAEWDAIKTVGDEFASSMFADCNGYEFTMNVAFNLPQNIKTVGKAFASNMFYGCRGGLFAMNDVFNLPQGISTVGEAFVVSMFTDCNGDAFTMNGVFDFPQNITTKKNSFAMYMFKNCNGAGFNVNEKIKIPNRVTGDFSFDGIFNLGEGAATQTRTAVDIISGAATPSYASYAFSPSTAWTDYASLDDGWK